MNYNYEHQTGEKTGLIDSYFSFSINSPSEKRQDLIVPDCTPGILYIEQGTFRRKSMCSEDELESGKLYLFGQKTKTAAYSFNGDKVSASGFKLYPTAIYSLFGIASHELTDKVVELDFIQNKEDLIELIQCSENRFNISRRFNQPEVINQLIHFIHNRNGIVNVNDICERFGMGYKRLERMFKQYVGVTPKLYARINRFNYSLKLGMKPQYNLTDIAYQSGFFDQNHFIKEVKMFCNKAPGEVISQSESVLEPDHLEYLRSRAY